MSLSSGDYRWHSILMELIGIERKSVTDFLGSLSNGSLADELRRLREEVDYPMLLLEGPINVNPATGFLYRIWYSGGKFKRQDTSWRLNNLIPAVYDFSRTLGVMPFYSPSILSTPDVLRMLFTWDQSQNHTAVFKARRYDYVVPSPASVMLAAVVGPKTAHSILKEFRTLRAVLGASVEDLMKVDGIGPKTASKVLSILDTEYADSGLFDLASMR